MRNTIRLRPLSATLALTMVLVACGDGGGGSAPTPTPPIAGPAPSPSPTPPAPPPPPPPPPPTASPSSFNVMPCLNQMPVPGRTVANLVVPDVLQLDLSRPSGFPNGRGFLDPVVDITLAVILLDLSRHSAATFASIPLNPNAVDQPLSNTFPFLAPPLGNPPIASGQGFRFRFRDDLPSAYTRVDRAAMPAVSTALIFPVPRKNEYNDDNPAIDATGKWVPSIVEQLQFYHAALADDFQRLGLTPCARPG